MATPLSSLRVSRPALCGAILLGFCLIGLRSASPCDVAFVPSVDSLVLCGSCVPPQFSCRLVRVSPDTDRVVICSYDVFLLGDKWHPTATFDSCYFEIRGATSGYAYEILYSSSSPDYPVQMVLPFDSVVYAMHGEFQILLRIKQGTTVVGSAQMRFFADQVGLAVDEPPGDLPSSPLLLQNYPNPFNAGTVISYDLPHAARVRIDIVDIAGRTAAILLDEQQSAGSHALPWRPVTLASGVYFVILRTFSHVEAIRTVLLK